MIDSEKIKVKIDKRITDITTTKVQKEYLNNVINTYSKMTQRFINSKDEKECQKIIQYAKEVLKGIK